MTPCDVRVPEEGAERSRLTFSIRIAELLAMNLGQRAFRTAVGQRRGDALAQA